jgi:RHS repeat-associated protein
LSVRLTLGIVNFHYVVTGQQAHLPFGEDFAESGTQQKQHFTSYERDSETGMDYAVNRHYRSAIGRFNNVDPILDKGFGARLSPGCAKGRTIRDYTGQPQSLSRYSYTLNDPANHLDPFGLENWDQCMERRLNTCGDEFKSSAENALGTNILALVSCIITILGAAAVAFETGGVAIPVLAVIVVVCAVALPIVAYLTLRPLFRTFKNCVENRRDNCRGLPGDPDLPPIGDIRRPGRPGGGSGDLGCGGLGCLAWLDVPWTSDRPKPDWDWR